MVSRFDDCPNLRLGAIAEVGPAGRRTMDAFTKLDSPGGNSERGLWQHKTTVTQSMSAQPDSGITGVPGKAEMAAKYWRQRGRFLLPKMDDCPVRRQPDLAGCAALGLEIGRGATIRQHLAAEPSVTGKRYAGWRLLSEWRLKMRTFDEPGECNRTSGAV